MLCMKNLKSIMETDMVTENGVAHIVSGLLKSHIKTSVKWMIVVTKTPQNLYYLMPTD